MDFELPVGRILGSRVKLVDTLKVRAQIGAGWSIDVNTTRHAREHFLLKKRGVKMARIEGDQPYGLICRVCGYSAKKAETEHGILEGS